MATGLLVLIASTLLINFTSPILRAGSGYAAKQICSGHFLSGFSPKVMVDEALVGATSILANISYNIDADTGRVDTRLYGLFPRTAIFRPGIGCTLSPSGAEVAVHQVNPVAISREFHNEKWTEANNSNSSMNNLDQIVELAFEETDSIKPLNTKAVVVVHKGKLIAERYADGVDHETPLLGWSMSKSVTNLLVGLLVADGKLDIFSPAPVPEWSMEEGDLRAAITIDQLLRMSSGLVFSEDYGLDSDVTMMLSVEPNMASFAASAQLESHPGERWHYSSGTSNILSGIAARAVGGGVQEFYNYSQERLFSPLGIETATLEFDASGTFIGSSYVYASARDWAKMGLLYLQDGQWQGRQLLPKNWVEYSRTPTPNAHDNYYGAHVWLNRNPENPDQQRAWPLLPEDTYAMSGYQGQFVVIIPSQNLVVVRMGFTPSENHGIEALVSGIVKIISKGS